MKVIKGAGVEHIDRYDHQKRQYRRALEIWQEKAEHECKVYHEEHCCRNDSDQWRGLFHIISELSMEAYTAGIEGAEEPDIIARIESVSEDFSDDPIGSEFWKIYAGIIRQSYTDGQEARR